MKIINTNNVHYIAKFIDNTDLIVFFPTRKIVQFNSIWALFSSLLGIYTHELYRLCNIEDIHSKTIKMMNKIEIKIDKG